jgi:hypothetical protein
MPLRAKFRKIMGYECREKSLNPPAEEKLVDSLVGDVKCGASKYGVHCVKFGSVNYRRFGYVRVCHEDATGPRQSRLTNSIYGA